MRPMHDPKTSDREVQRFEKEVQQKMEELEFSPSAAVWANVEKAVRVEKKRRVPFFWLFFLPALLLMGGARFYFMGSHKNPSSLNANKMTGQASNAANATPRTLTGKEIATPPTKKEPCSRNHALAANTKPLDQSTIGKGDAIPLDKPAASASIHLNPVNVKSIVGIQAAPLAKSPALARTRLTPKRAWEAGFTGGVGMSSLNQTLFKRSAVTANDTRNLAAPIPVTGAAAPTYVSQILPDLSFWAGIF